MGASGFAAALLSVGCETPPAPDFTLACAASPDARAWCGAAACTLTGTNGFSASIALSGSGSTGLRAYGLPPTVTLEQGERTFDLGFSADPSANSTHQFQVTATADDITHDAALELSFAFLPPTSIPGDMVLAGCAGLNGVVGDVPPLSSVYVGAWRSDYRVDLCGQTLPADDGAYVFMIPRTCPVAPGNTVYMTSGGFDACTVTFTAGTVQRFDAIAAAPCP